MVGTPPLWRFARGLPLEVETLGSMDAEGRIAWGPGILPPEGPCVLALWRPGARPQFVAARGALRREGRAWRFEGAPLVPGEVVLVVPP